MCKCRGSLDVSIPSPSDPGELPLREEVTYLQGQMLELQHLSQDQDAELDRLRFPPHPAVSMLG